MSERLYSVKMRAARAGAHVSGAEKIVPAKAVSQIAAQLVERALGHPKGTPDFVNLKVEAQAEPIRRLPALKVTNHLVTTPSEGRRLVAELLRAAGIARVDAIMARFAETHALRGAMLLDADTLERLDTDPARGIRATYMDDADSLEKGTARAKNHFAEAIVLATKVAAAPNIVGEICVSDDPDYVTGYVASKEIGYHRITVLKEKGDANGGRIFLYRGAHDKVSGTIAFLEKTPVLVTGVPDAACRPRLQTAPVDAVYRPRQRFDALRETLEAREAAGLSRQCRTFASPAGPTATIDESTNRKIEKFPFVVLSSNDYLDLARDPRVTKAAAEAAVQWGAGSGGARLTTGTQPPHVALEAALAEFKGTEAALVYGTGYMANVGVISALVGKEDVILSDALNHASIIDGCRLSGAKVLVYPHGDLDALERLLATCTVYRRRLVVSDGVFSMDGDLLDLPKFLAITKRHDAFSMVDEAHATGVIGKTGRGLSEHFGCGHPDILIGTMSKALGSEGGFVCGSKLLIDYLRNLSRSFIFSTAPGAPAMAAALAALKILDAEPERVRRLQENVAFFLAELGRHGISAKTASAIVPLVIGDEKKALQASVALERAGFLVPAIRYPTVARGSARLRVTIMSAHTHGQLARAAEVLAEVSSEETACV